MQQQIDTRGLVISWFDINTIDAVNFRFHLEQTPAQEAWLAEKTTEADLEYRNAVDQADEMKSIAFMLAKKNPYTRMSAQKGEIKVDCSDAIAEHIAKIDPTYLQLKKVVNQLRADRDRWLGYSKAMQTKKAFLASLAGITRDELKQFK